MKKVIEPERGYRETNKPNETYAFLMLKFGGGAGVLSRFFLRSSVPSDQIVIVLGCLLLLFLCSCYLRLVLGLFSVLAWWWAELWALLTSVHKGRKNITWKQICLQKYVCISISLGPASFQFKFRYQEDRKKKRIWIWVILWWLWLWILLTDVFLFFKNVLLYWI